MNSVNTFELPETLPPKTAMALFEFFEALTSMVWEKYEDELVLLCCEESINDRYLEESLHLENNYCAKKDCDKHCKCDCGCGENIPF